MIAGRRQESGMDATPQPPHRYVEPQVTAAWYDLRGFLAARRLLLAQPRLALEGERALGFSARGFAHFLWIVMPFGVLAALASVNGLLLEQPNQVFDLNADAAAELRVRIAPDATLWREAGLEPGSPLEFDESAQAASETARRKMAGLHVMPFISLDNAEIGEAERLAALAAIQAGLQEASEGQPAVVRLQLAQILERRLLGTEKRLRFMRRLVETGAVSLLGMVFTGLLLPFTAMAFAWWARRMLPPGEHVDQARSVMLYLLTARLTPWMFLTVGCLVAAQVGVSWQLSTLANVSIWLLIALTLLFPVVYFRCGRLIAPVLYEAPDPLVARKLGWRMVWVFLLQQLVTAFWAILFAIGVAIYFYRFA